MSEEKKRKPIPANYFSLDSRLQNAVEENEVETVRQSLKEGDDFYSRDNDGEFLFIVAVQKGHLDIVRLFLEFGADPNLCSVHSRFPALHLAVISGQFEIVKCLKEYKANMLTLDPEGYTALLYASAFGHLNICKLFDAPECWTKQFKWWGFFSILNRGHDYSDYTVVDIAHSSIKQEIIEIYEQMKKSLMIKRILNRIAQKMEESGLAAKNGIDQQAMQEFRSLTYHKGPNWFAANWSWKLHHSLLRDLDVMNNPNREIDRECIIYLRSLQALLEPLNLPEERTEVLSLSDGLDHRLEIKPEDDKQKENKNKPQKPQLELEEFADLSADQMYLLASRLYFGEGIEKNHKEAGKYYQLAADKGHKEAQNALALIYKEGLCGLDKDPQKAFFYFQASANQGHMESQWALAVIYRIGMWGVTKNLKESLKWFELSANQGYKEAQYQLGSDYIEGDGVDKDLEKGLHFLILAAKQNDTDALENLDIVIKEEIKRDNSPISKIKEHIDLLEHDKDQRTIKLAEEYLKFLKGKHSIESHESPNSSAFSTSSLLVEEKRLSKPKEPSGTVSLLSSSITGFLETTTNHSPTDKKTGNPPSKVLGKRKKLTEKTEEKEGSKHQKTTRLPSPSINPKI